jgi:hypothetical protein
MDYKLHRIAPNSDGWKRPSPGRLGAEGVGPYVKKNGFGYEDWNFNFSFASNGEMPGYTVAKPSVKLAEQDLGVILATYYLSGWKAVGYYNGARFKRDDRFPDSVIEQMVINVFELAERKSVSSEFANKTLAEIGQTFRKELKDHWVIPTDRVFIFDKPVEIPKKIFDPGARRMNVSFNISESDFDQIIELGDSAMDRADG